MRPRYPFSLPTPPSIPTYPALTIHRLRAGNVEVMRALLDAKCEVDVSNSRGATSLYAAISGNHIEAAELLLSHGADVNARTSDQNSMVHLAVYNGESEMIKVLLKHDPEFVTGSDKKFVHPVAIAAFMGEFGILHDLVDYLVNALSCALCKWNNISKHHRSAFSHAFAFIGEKGRHRECTRQT